ncbi:YqaJ viral recombinase family nuclease [Effusibacillus dendaii]|uniref:YqaJ viral recombinase domain-containing protein n=1 Tax=Effusibacillus dendaii TaxID=2743772 RepID=A0A7I8DF04_9BACL|nr:YqaJ viral recombinase family protein [Effusibacillus dendaii]BCJ86491.1 hypothetical protein skT53_14760 [Effusibacillus dendaii]
MSINILAATKDMGRDEWLEWRRKGIGGSDVSAIAGLNKYKSAIQVYLEKIGEWPEEDEQSEAAYWGTRMEDVIAEEFQKRTGIKVRRRNVMFRHPKYPWMIANLDRVVIGENAGLECKTASEYLKEEWQGEDIPNSYMLQIQHYMEVCQFNHMYIAVLIGGNKFVWKKIERDQEMIDYIIKIEADFWRKVETRTMPMADGSPATTEVMKILYPKSDRSICNLPDEAKLYIDQYEAYKAEEKEAAERAEEAKNRLKMMLGDKEIGFVNERKVCWKNTAKGRRFTIE